MFNVRCFTSSSLRLNINEGTVFPSHIFPRSISAIIRAHNVEEFHLSLVAGRWEYDRWSWPLIKHGAASGAELWAWIGEQPNKRWVFMIHFKV